MAERIIKRIYNSEIGTPKGQTAIPKRRVAAYARVSTASDEQLNSTSPSSKVCVMLTLVPNNYKPLMCPKDFS